MKRRREGFTLLEIMVSVALVALAVGLGLVAARGARSKMGVKAYAMQLLADLRWSRERARANGYPCGVGLSSGGPTCAYIVVGVDPTAPGPGVAVSSAPALPDTTQAQMTVLRTNEWSADRGAVVGFLDGTIGAFSVTADARQDGPAGTIAKNQAQTTPARYLLFQPNGAVLSNLPADAAGDRVIVVGEGLSGGSGALTGVKGEAMSIRVTPLGGLSLEQGASGLASTASPTTPTGLPTVAATPNATHAITIRMDTLPELNSGATIPDTTLTTTNWSGPKAAVRGDGHLTLSLHASDAQGHRLYCQWQGAVGTATSATQYKSDAGPSWDATASDVTTGGAFSENSKVLHPMSASADGWVDTTEWAPPAGTTPGDFFLVGARAQDILRSDGKYAEAWILVVISSNNPLMYRKVNSGVYDIFSADVNGGSPMNITRNGTSSESVWSADGGLMVTLDNVLLMPVLYNGDGTNPRKLSQKFDGGCDTFTVSADFTRVVFNVSPPGGYASHPLYLGTFDNRTNASLLTQQSDDKKDTGRPRYDVFPRWSPGGDLVTFVRGYGLGTSTDGLSRAMYIPIGSTVPDSVYKDATSYLGDTRGVYRLFEQNGGVSPDGKYFLFASTRSDFTSPPVPSSYGRTQIYVVDATTRVGPVNVSPDPANSYVWPQWSPDGRQIAFIDYGAADGNGSYKNWSIRVAPYDPTASKVIGTSRVVADNKNDLFGDTGHSINYAMYTWSADGRYIYEQYNGQIYRVSTDGSNTTPQPVTFDTGQIIDCPQMRGRVEGP